MKRICFSILTLIGLGSACAQIEDNPPVEANLRSLELYEEQLAEASSRFALDLFHQLNKSEDPNQFYSPYSIHQALSMTMNGNEGEVLAEFLDLLRYAGMSTADANLGAKELTEFLQKVDPKVKVNIANGIWYKKEFQVQVPFKQTAENYFKAGVTPLDMASPQAPDIINKWIENQTNGLIRDMLDNIPDNAAMYLVNAIYYKGDWKVRFDKQKTQKAPFYPESGPAVEVDMMETKEAAQVKSHQSNGLLYYEIPYSTGQYSMGILMHPDGKINQYADQLTYENLQNWRNSARETAAILKIPKFKMSYKLDNMKEDLMEMGLVRPFQASPENFTLLFSNPTEPMQIERVIHEALIEVDEEGTEAAAATVVEIGLTSMPSAPQMIVLDKPFIFFIQEKHSGAILFMGKLSDPSLL